MAVGSPWAFHAHAAVWVTLAAAAAAYAIGWRRGLGGRTRHVVSFTAGLASAAAVLTWPVGDLAAHWSVVAHVGQHVGLALVTAPLLLLGLPRRMVMALTEPAPVDRVVRVVATPVIAALIFNAVILGAHLPATVDLDVRVGWVHAAINIAVLAAGMVMWLPVLRVVPGTNHLSGPGRVSYLLIQSIVPNVPAAFLTFATAPVYRRLAGPADYLGLSPVLDTQLAGALAKVVGAGILWVAAAIVFFGSHRAEAAGRDPNPLTWDDVERELRRVDRRRARPAARAGRTDLDLSDWPSGGEAPPWERPDLGWPADPRGPAET